MTLPVNSRAAKIGGSYQAEGTIVSAFTTTTGEQRYVFEFDTPNGMLHIFGPSQLVAIGGPVEAIWYNSHELPLPKVGEVPSGFPTVSGTFERVKPCQVFSQEPCTCTIKDLGKVCLRVAATVHKSSAVGWSDISAIGERTKQTIDGLHAKENKE